MMLAQATLPDPNHYNSVGWVCVILVAIIVGLRAGMGFVRDLKDKPSPGDVARESTAMFAQKSELNAHIEWNRREHENLFSKIGGVGRGADERMELRTESLRKEINDVGRSVAGLEKETELQNQRMASMDAKLDRLIERS